MKNIMIINVKGLLDKLAIGCVAYILNLAFRKVLFINRVSALIGSNQGPDSQRFLSKNSYLSTTFVVII